MVFFCIPASFFTPPNCDVYDLDDIDAFGCRAWPRAYVFPPFLFSLDCDP
jgi:hypothetical protein